MITLTDFQDNKESDNFFFISANAWNNNPSDWLRGGGSVGTTIPIPIPISIPISSQPPIFTDQSPIIQGSGWTTTGFSGGGKIVCFLQLKQF